MLKGLKALNELRKISKMAKDFQDPNISEEEKKQLEKQAEEMMNKSLEMLQEKSDKGELNQEGLDIFNLIKKEIKPKK